MIDAFFSEKFTVTYEHRLYFTRDSFNAKNSLLQDLICEADQKSKVLIAVDEKVARASSELLQSIHSYMESNADLLELRDLILMPGGELLKNDDKYLKLLYHKIEDARLCRHSYVIALGGGALLDLVGYAAATAHRGVRHLRMPTTSLSQGDGGVGVKNGINFNHKKNFIGSFAPPYAIINDLDFLKTLPQKDARGGLSEAIKVALIKDIKFFEWIEDNLHELKSFEGKAIAYLIQRSAELHIRHITGNGDPFETGSARPLDFGHWSAHKLEQMSDFEMSHGDAVAIGIALDTIYGHLLGNLNEGKLNRVLSLLSKLGFPLFCEELGQGELLEGLLEFQEHIGGELTITLLDDLGKSYETHQMISEKIVSSVEFLKNWTQNTLCK
ncbi:MAG: 3-dehydroquinate synthase [Verrucomicrobiota bacterium]